MDCVAPVTWLRGAWRHFSDVCPSQKGKHVHTDEWTWYFCFRARRIFLYILARQRSLCCALVKNTLLYHLDSVEMQAACCFPPWMLLLLMCNVHLLVSDSAASVLQTIVFSNRRRWKRTDVLYRGGGYILECCYLFIYSRSNKLLLWVDTVVLTEKCCVNAILRHSPLRSFFLSIGRINESTMFGEQQLCSAWSGLPIWFFSAKAFVCMWQMSTTMVRPHVASLEDC